MATLGISTNTRLLGMAIINTDGLAEYSIRLHKSSWSPSKANLMITSLEPCVRQYCINSVVLSIPPEHHQTKEFQSLLAAIRKYFSDRSIPVFLEALATLKHLCPADVKSTKKVLMKTLVERYPELRLYYDKEMRNRNKYYVKLFEAVGLAALHKQ